MKTILFKLKALCFAGLIAVGVSSLLAQADTPAEAAAPGATNQEPAQATPPDKEEIPAGLAEAMKEQASRPPENTVTNDTDLKSFRIIADRNIFNPNRSPRSSSRNTNSTPAPRPVRIETFAMVGMISSEKGAFAFFDGSSSNFRKAVKEGETIANFKVAEVGHDYVQLQEGEKGIRLTIGMQMKKQDEGEWQVIQKTETTTTLSPSSSSSGSSSSGPVAGDDDPVVRRMMQNRDKESK